MRKHHEGCDSHGVFKKGMREHAGGFKAASTRSESSFT